MERPEELLPRIRTRIQEMRLTQTEVATYLGLRQSSLSRRLSGQSRFTVDDLAKLLPWLGLSPTPQRAVGEDDLALPLLKDALGVLTDTDRAEFLLLVASVLEGKLREPDKTRLCGALRVLASGG